MRLKVVALVAALVAFPYSLAFGISVNTFNQIITFGDSLSDPGNASFLSAGAEPVGSNYATRTVGSYQLKYWTDGTNTTPATTGPTGLWIDQLAGAMGMSSPAPAWLNGTGPATGTNFAVGGASTGSVSPVDMQNQVNKFLAGTPSAPASALYAFWGGANDIENALSTNPATAGAVAVAAANNIENEIKQVSTAGGQYFLWLDLPPLGETPAGLASGPLGSAAANAASEAFNAQYQMDLKQLSAMGIDVIPVDINTLFEEILADPSAFGFTDVTDACENFTGSTCTSSSNPNDWLFWDDQHPTTAADALVADAALAAIQSAPEPGTYALLMLGGLGLIGWRKFATSGK